MVNLQAFFYRSGLIVFSMDQFSPTGIANAILLRWSTYNVITGTAVFTHTASAYTIDNDLI